MVECRIPKQADALWGSDRASEGREKSATWEGSSVVICGVDEAGKGKNEHEH